MDSIDAFMSENWIVVQCVAPIFTAVVAVLITNSLNRISLSNIDFGRMMLRVAITILNLALNTIIVLYSLDYLFNPTSIFTISVLGLSVGLKAVLNYLTRDSEVAEATKALVTKLFKAFYPKDEQQTS